MLQHHVHSELIPGRVPQELIDHIVDHLHDDKRSLETCVGVAPNWAESALYHIHHTHSVLAYNIAKDKKSTFTHGLHALERDPVACKYIQVLHLIGQSMSPIQSPLDPSSLITILAILSSLKVLRIRRARLQSQTVHPLNDSQQFIHPRSTSSGISLRCLDLHHVHILDDDPFLPIIRLLLLFDSIDSFGASMCSCRRTDWRSQQWQGLEILSQMDLPTHFRVLSLFVHPRQDPRACIGDVFVNMVRRTRTQTLKTFECLLFDVPAKLELLQGLISDAGSSIENLTLRFVESDIPESSLDISGCNSLRRLTFRLQRGRSENSEMRSFDATLEVLSRVSSTALVLNYQIEFVPTHSHNFLGSMSRVNWRGLQDIILRRCSDLKQLTIKFHHDMETSEVFKGTREHVREQLSQLDAKGVLGFDWAGAEKRETCDRDKDSTVPWLSLRS